MELKNMTPTKAQGNEKRGRKRNKKEGAMDNCCNAHKAHSLHKQLSNFPSIFQGTLDSGSSGDFLNKNSPQQNVKKQTTPSETKQPDG